MSLQLILRNIISTYYIRTIRGKLTPPTSHRFTLSVLDSHRDPPHIALQLKAVPGWLGPLQRGPEVMRNDVIMFHPVVQRFRFKDRHRVARIRQDSVGRQNGITHSTESFREVILSPWGNSPLFMIPDLTDRINLIRLLLATNRLQPPLI